MDQPRDRDTARELAYLYERLRRLDDAIRSIEALAQMRRQTEYPPPGDTSPRGKARQEPT